MIGVLAQLFKLIHARRVQRSTVRTVAPTDYPLVSRVLHPVYHDATQCPQREHGLTHCGYCLFSTLN